MSDDFEQAVALARAENGAAAMVPDEWKNRIAHPSESPDWRVKDTNDADWCLQRLAELEREQAELDAMLAAASKRLNERHQVLSERITKGVTFFASHLRGYFEEHKATLLTGKKKTRQLLHGSIGTRKSGGGLKVTDIEALLAWARLQPVESGVLRIKEEPAISAIKQHMKSTGELPDGCEQEAETEEFQWKTNDGSKHGSED